MDESRLYWTDPYMSEFSTTVTAHHADGVMLEQTAFYPTGGGQPNDTGTIETGTESWTVTDVNGRDPIVHVVDEPLPPIGETVQCTIDWDRRMGHMRHHTAQHLLSAILLDDFGAPTTGNQLYADRARLDCEHDRLDEAAIERLERDMQAYIEEDIPVRTRTMSRSTAEADLDPQRTRLDLLPSSVTTVRIVEIVGVDLTACGGTHVNKTGELGSVHITGRETGGKDRERIRFSLDTA